MRLQQDAYLFSLEMDSFFNFDSAEKKTNEVKPQNGQPLCLSVAFMYRRSLHDLASILV